jgi:Arc/MetJ family transcription regulator
MRTTLIINDKLMARAMELTNIKEKTALVHAGLEALIARIAQDRLIALGGKDKKAKSPVRRRAS